MVPRKTWSRRLALAGGAAAAAGGYWALRLPGGSAHHAIADARTLRRGNAAEPQTLDPSLSTGIQDDAIMGDLMVGLLAQDSLCRAIPGVATRWTTSPDGLTWTFFLRPCLWSDGEPVTAEDFVFSWRRLVDPITASPYAYFIYVFKNAAAINAGKLPLTALGARAIDPYTVEIRLEHPAPYLLEMMTHATTVPLPRHVVTAKGKTWTKPGNYVGNGAFTLKTWIPNDHVLVVKNPRFYEADQVNLERVYFYPSDDYATGMARMRAGELDTQDKMPAQKVEWILANIPQTIHRMPQLTTEYIVPNMTRKPFNDVRVRHAINLVLNREVLAQRIWRGGGVAAYGLVPPGTANYPGGVSFDFQKQNYAARVEVARSLMRAAGFGENNRAKVTYMIRGTAPGTYRAGAAAIQQMLAQMYMDTAILPTDFPVFLAQTQSHDFDLAQPGWGADFNDAATFLELLQTGGGNNHGLYSNPAYDGMLAAAQNDLDLTSRGQKLAAAERIALNDHGIMPLFFWTDPGMFWPYLKGWQSNPLDHHRSRWVTIDQAARIKQFS